jgi:hypothetical protein
VTELDLCFSDSWADQYNIHFGGFLLLLLLKFHNCAGPGPSARDWWPCVLAAGAYNSEISAAAAAELLNSADLALNMSVHSAAARFLLLLNDSLHASLFC